MQKHFCRLRRTALNNLKWIILAAAALAHAGTDESALQPPNAANKDQYHLFKPTPGDLLREMVTDRPDQTESPYTVDAGHFQVEMDLFVFGQDHDQANGADTVTREYNFSTLNLKMGLLNNLDAQLMLSPYSRVDTEDRQAGTRTRAEGFGDITVRLKQNLWGNDGGKTAFGLMPFVKFPTSRDALGNEAVEGGLILPLAIELPKGWSLGLMTEFDFMRNANNRRYHPEFINSITFGHDLIGKLEGYVEFFSAVSTDRDARWMGMVDAGLVYGLTKNLRLDGGINIGVTRAANDWNPFVGLSWRF